MLVTNRMKIMNVKTERSYLLVILPLINLTGMPNISFLETGAPSHIEIANFVEPMALDEDIVVETVSQYKNPKSLL